MASTTAVMYSMPLIVAPAAAVGSGSCQTSVRVRVACGVELGGKGFGAASTAAAGKASLTGGGRRLGTRGRNQAGRRVAE